MKLAKANFKSFIFLFAATFLLGMGIIGCTSTSAPDLVGEEKGEIAISLTDVEGEFASYTVDVLSVNLTHANGAQVSTLPLQTRIDFSQYTEMTEFLTAATIPSGVYVSATLTLDYQDADIWAENENGELIEVKNILDENGDPITTLEASVRLEDQNQLTIAPGIPAHLMLDFDLQASNQVSFDDPDGPSLTVDPFLVAEVNRTNAAKIHRIRGLMNEVDLESSSFSVILRPFYRPLSDNHRRFGIRAVMTNENTLFDINGEQYQGTEGLDALNDLDQLTPVVAIGDLKFQPLGFMAREVYAGSSVPGSTMDVVKGNVIKRTDDRLTVKGASLIRRNSSVAFNDEVTIWIADTTRVKRQLSDAPFDTDDISVGQRLTVFGTLTNSDPFSPEMNAAEGSVRMLLTTIRGTVIASNGAVGVSQLTLNLQSIDCRRVSVFDFSGTGFTETDDADPDNYEVATGTLDISTLSAGYPAKLRGFPEAFGQAPPDFYASTLIDVLQMNAYIKVNWYPATEKPFEIISPEGLRLNLTGVGRQHHLILGGVLTDLTELENTPSLVPDNDGEGLYILRYNDVTEIHTIFEHFADSISELLEEGFRAKRLHATGQFDDATVTLTAAFIEIRFN